MSINYISKDKHLLQLLEQKRQIDAELAKLSTPNAPSASQSQHGRHRGPQQIKSRSYSYNGQPMTRRPSFGRGQLEAIPMSTSVSLHTAPMMVSNGLQAFPPSGSSMRFTKSVPALHPLDVIDSRQDTSVIESWATGFDDPTTTYCLQPQQAFHPLSQRKSDMDNVAEIDSGLLPIEYFNRTDTMSMFPASQSPVDTSAGNKWRSLSHRGSTSSRRRPSIGIASPTTPSSGTLTSGSTFESEMSRQNSLSNDAILGPFEMLNVHSNNSIYTESICADELSYQTSSPFSKFLSSEEQSQLLVGAGGASANSTIPHSLQDVGDAMAHLSSQPSLGGDMKRSQSNESSSSSSSLTSRATAQLKRQNQLASRRLAPKAGSEEVAMQREGSHTMVSMKTRDGSESRAVQPIAKTPYQRPKHARVFCDLCSEYPEGFRGQHELRRHHDRQHKEQVKKYVCVEPADGYINPQYQPTNPLSSCKSCLNQKKKYGAYYNAAAHLRRSHFRPKQRGGRKSAKVDDKSEKRSSNGGREWPPMEECKRWMKEVSENVTEGDQQNEEEEEEDVDDEDCNRSYENDDSYTKLHDTSNISGNNLDFDSAYMYGDTPMLDAYPTPPTSFNSQSMQNIAYDNLALSQSIDLTMRVEPSHASFADSQFASMNDMTFIDPFPQAFADQILGPDSFPNFQY